MKGFLTLLLLFWACLAGTALTAVNAAPSLLPMGFNKTLNPGAGKSTPRPANRLARVVIDAGHGGHDPGCDHAPEYEKIVNLKVAQLLFDGITANYPDIEVSLTRDDDTYLTLADRAAFANGLDADLFISLHANYSPNEQAYGTETWVYRYGRGQRNRHSRLFAQTVEEAFEMIGRHSRGLRDSKFAVLKLTKMPAVLVELGFLSNAEEQKYLLSQHGQLELTNSLLDAFGTYYEQVTGRNSVDALVKAEPATIYTPPKSVSRVAPPAQPASWVGKEIQPGLSEPLASTDVADLELGQRTTASKPALGKKKKPLIALPPPIKNTDAPTVIAVQVAALSKPWVSVPAALTSFERRITEVKDGALYRYQIRHLASESDARAIIRQLKSQGQDGMLVVYRGEDRLTGMAMTVALEGLAVAERARLAK